MNNDKFFISIGVFKAGSTWLHETLDKHPEVEMPYIKELRYFYHQEFCAEKAYLYNNLFSDCWLFKDRRRYCYPFFKETIKKSLKLKPVNWKKLRWYLHFFCVPQNDRWYKNLFPKNKYAGDVSPHYARLSEASIKRIKELNFDAKIIIGLRDPVERIWSFVKMQTIGLEGDRKNTRLLSKIDKRKVLKRLSRNKENPINDYTTLLNQWKRVFDSHQIFIYYYEELQDDPQKLYSRICAFLEIEPIDIENVEQVYAKGVMDKISNEYKKELIQLNYGHIKKFAENYPNQYSLAWVEKYKDYL